MQVKIPLLSAIVILTTIIAIPLATRPVSAIPGNSVDNPANIWYPYGPLIHNLQMQFYSTETVEFTNFELGHIDVTDWELPPAKYASYDGNPDFLLTPGQGQFGDFGQYWNGASSTWPAWGCDWGTGTPFTTGRTSYTTACSVNMRQAFIHLVDRPRFVTDSVLQGAAQALADDSPPAKTPAASPLATQCSWDTMHPNCISAYNLAPDPGGFAAPGSLDFCAAADHMIAAGVAAGKTAGSCVLTGINAGVFTHHLRAMIRNNDPRRLALGNGAMNAINQLFGATVVDPTYGNINQIGFPIVFSDPPTGPIDDWDSYTYGYGFPSPFPDQLNDLFDSQFASDYCGGTQNDFPDNPTFVCVPVFDIDSRAAVSTLDVPTFNAATLATMNDGGKFALSMPVFAPGIRIAALRSVAGLVNQRGNSYTNLWTMLYAHQDPGYTPANSAFAFGGGDPTTLRWGQASPTTELNPFQIQTVWEFNVGWEIYDTLFSNGGSAVEPANVYCWMCNTYQQSVDLSGNEHFLVELRQDLRWQDDIGGSAASPVNGAPIDAYDVKFSLLNLRDHAKNWGSGLRSQSLQSVTVLSPTTMDIVFKGASLSNPVALEANMLPRHLWELPGDTTYGDVGRVDPAKSTTSYDPITAGTFIGSSALACQSVFSADLGKVGTGCVKNADGSRGGQAVPIGGTLLLQRFDYTAATGDPFAQFHRSYNTGWGTGTGAAAHSGLFQEFSWADKFDNATVTIRDLASAAACFGKTSQGTGATQCADYNYWHESAFSGGAAIGPEVTFVASHLDDTFISPFSWNGVQSQQPGQTLENLVGFTP